MEGIVPELIRRIVRHKFFIKKIRFDTVRMQDHNLAAKLLLIEHRGQFADTKADQLDALVEEGLRGTKKPFVQAERRVISVLNDMLTVFKDQDSLLGSAGHIPVYYWLVKHYPDDTVRIRNFLRQFLGKLKENQIIIQEEPKAGDPELSQYYTMGRTTNDQGSLRGRYEILEQRFKQFLKKGRSQNF
jgi:hypothetical protein